MISTPNTTASAPEVSNTLSQPTRIVTLDVGV